jgi:hypothetical protein
MGLVVGKMRPVPGWEIVKAKQRCFLLPSIRKLWGLIW